jgi:hypothetical protein
MLGSLVNGVVLCLCSDGQVEVESAFHQRCDDPGHSEPAEKNQLSYQPDHTEDKHCQPCVDIPISIDLAKITRASKELSSAFSTTAINLIVLADKSDLSTYNSALKTFDTVCYFSPLRTVILVV